MPPKHDVFHDAPNVNDTTHTAFNVELSLTKPDKDLSHTHRPLAPIIEDWVSDSEDDFETQIPQDVPSFVQTNEQVKSLGPSVKTIEISIPNANTKTTILKPKNNGNCRNRKACFVCKSLDHLIKDCDFYERKMAQTLVRNYVQRGYHQQYARMTFLNSQKHVIPTAVLTKSKLVPITAARPVTAAVLKLHVTRPRPAKSIVTKPHSQPRRHIDYSLSPKASNFLPKVTAVKGNPQHALKDKGVIDSRCSRHVTGNMSYLSDFEKIIGGYVAFGGNPKGDSLLRIPFWAEAVNIACYVQNRVLVTKPQNKTPYELLHGRTPSIGFMGPFGSPVTILNTLDPLGGGPTWLFDIDILTKTMNYQPVTAGNHSNPSNTDRDAAFDDKKLRFEGRKPESEVYVSPSSSAQIKKHDDKTKREAKGKSPIESLKVYKNLSAEFEDFSNCSINEVNAADSLVPAVGKISTNNTNTFSVTGPSNATVSPTHRKSSYVDSFQLPDDPNRLELEDITYSDDEDDELLQFKIQKVWVLVDLPHKKRAIGHTQDEGINYEEVFAPVARIEAIRLFLAYASFMGFMVYQMDVKSAFLYETIEEEVYVCQPPGFEDHDYPNKVYKVVKALYGLYQTPRAWYETLANHLLENGFQKGKIDQTLFIKRQKGDILLVQIYVDNIIFGSTNKDLCKDFEKLMKDKFQMSSMGELTFFLGLQVKQKQDGIFISQDIYVAKTLRKFSLTDGKSASTPIDTKKHLLKDPDGEDVDVHTYKSMISSLMYLTSSRPDIMFAVCACPHFQVTLKALHLHAVKRIFRYLKGKPHLGLWYPKDSPFNLVAYSDSDYAGASLDKKSTTRGCQILGCRLISWKCKKQTVGATSSTEAEYVATASCFAQVLWILNQLLDYGLQALVDKKKVIITEATIRDALRLDDAEGINCLPNEEIFTELARMGYEKPSTKLTFYKAFFSSQWKFLIHTILQCMSAKRTSWNEFSSSMASTVICLSTGRKFNFSKYIFNSLVRNVDSSTKFYMYPRFLQLMMRAQVGDLSSHTIKYSSPALTQKVFANMRMVGKGFSGVDTPLFEGVLLAQQVDESAAELNVDVFLMLVLLMKLPLKIDTSDDTVMDDVSKQGKIIADMDADVDVTLKDIAKDVVVDAEIKESSDVQGRQVETLAQIYQIDLEHADKVLSMQDDEVEPAKLQEVVEVVTTAKLITEVVTVASATITIAAPQLTTAAASQLTTAPSAARRRNRVVISDLEETDTPSTIIHSEAKSKDKGKEILVEEPKPIKKQARIEQDEAYARELEAELNKNIDWDEKIKEQMEEEDSKALKKLSENQEDKAAKKQKLDEEDISNEATKKTQKTLLKQMYENFNAPSTDTNSTNGVHTAYGVSTASTQSSTASTQVSTASSQTGTANLSDATVYAFLANQSNGSQLVHKDLEQIQEDNLEEMDLKWQLALLSMRAKRFSKKLERRSLLMEVTQLALISLKWSVTTATRWDILQESVEGLGTKIAETDEVPTNMALMTFSDSENASEDIPNELKEYSDAPLVKDIMSDNKDYSVESPVVVKKKIVVPLIAKVEVVRPKQQEKLILRNSIEDILPLGKEQMVAEFTGKGTIKTDNLDFEDVYFVKELKFNLFSVSQMCDRKKNVLFTDTECLALSPNFKLLDESQILLRVHRKNNMYSVGMKNIVPKESLTCLVAKAALDESILWHRRLGHINFKNINKLVKDKLVRGLPLKHFENDQTCVDCLKGKQYKAFCKSNIQNFISQPLFMLHMDLFGPTFVSSLIHKTYGLVVTDDYSIYTWIFFLATKDETTGILKKFITEIENLVDKKVKVITCDNRTEFKNSVMSDFCAMKGIRREFSIARTPWQNGVAEWRNRTLIEAARTMALVVKPHNKTPYELFRGKTPAVSFMRPFGCHVTILNTLDHLGKFDGKADEGYFVGYSMNSKAFRVYNIRTRRVKENLHIEFLKNKPIVAAVGPEWLFDIDMLTKSMNYVPVIADKESGALNELNSAFENLNIKYLDDPKMPGLETIATYDDSEEEADFTNLEPSIHRKLKPTNEQGFISAIYEEKTHEDLNTCLFACFLSQIEPTRVAKALSNHAWVEAMQEELLRFKLQKVWILLDLPKGKKAIARIKAIRLFLAYASFMGFMVYHMDVKSDFLYERIKEEVYVCQPPGFKDPDHPGKVYKVVKALYGLHQAPRAWYDTLAKYLSGNGFHRGKTDQTLFIKRQKGDILLVHVYVDDIIFGSTKKELCTEFERLMKDKFQMSSMGELTFFLGLKVKQKENEIFISQDKYVAECKKQTVVATSATKAEYMAAASCCGQDKQSSMVGFGEMIQYNLTNGLYALTKNPAIYVSLIQQFWQPATASTLDNGEIEITATIDGKVKVVTEASVRRHLKLEDSDCISNLPTTEIFEQLALMCYVANSDKLTFQKGHFSPQWRFFILVIHHCLSAKKTGWEQFSSNIAIALICLATNKKFNFSKLIFDSMVKNLDSKTKFFINMKKASKGYFRVDISLFPIMLVQGLVFQGEGSTAQQETKIPQSSSPHHTNVADEAASTGVDVRHGGAATTEVSTTEKEVSIDEPVSTAGAAVTTASIDVSPASPTRRVSTADDITLAETLVYIRRSAAKDKGKGIMTESEPVQTKTKLQQEQERLGYKAAVRLLEELDEEERRRMARVHEAAQSFTEEE
nr:putative ribonuclease H-like domain-containing protein [Tanacetum cinerariifolium]